MNNYNDKEFFNWAEKNHFDITVDESIEFVDEFTKAAYEAWNASYRLCRSQQNEVQDEEDYNSLFYMLQLRLESMCDDPYDEAERALGIIHEMSSYPVELTSNDPVAIVIREILEEEEIFSDYDFSNIVYWNLDRTIALLCLK